MVSKFSILQAHEAARPSIIDMDMDDVFGGCSASCGSASCGQSCETTCNATCITSKTTGPGAQ